MEPGQHPTEFARELGVELHASALLRLQRSMLREELEDQGGGPRVVVQLARDEGKTWVGGSGERVVCRRLARESPPGLGVDGPLQQEGRAVVDLDSIDEVPAGKSTAPATTSRPSVARTMRSSDSGPSR